MIWILPALAIVTLATLWNWNLRIRREYERLMAEGAEALSAAKYPQALGAFEHAFRTAERLRLDNHDQLVWSTLNAATALRFMGEKDAALELVHSALYFAETHELAKQPGKADYCLRLYTLSADLAEENGLAHKSIGLRQQAVGLHRQQLGDDSLALAEQIAKLGAAYGRGGLPDHSAQQYAEAVEISARSVAGSEENREVHATYLAWWGDALVKLGQIAKAEETYSSALKLQRELHGGKDVRLVPALSGLGGVYGAQKRFEDAIRCFEEAYKLQVRAFGPSDARVGLILTHYAQCLNQAGKIESAEDAAARAVKLLEMHEHPALATSLAALGGVLMANGDYENAVNAFERADAAVVTRLSSGSPLETAQRLEQHADALQQLNRILEAERLREGAKAIRETLASVPPARRG